MFEFTLLNDEEIKIISRESLLKYHDTVLSVDVIVTNQRFLILSVPNDSELFRIGRMIDQFKVSKKEIIFEVLLSDIVQIEDNKHYDKYILKDTNYFYLHDDVVRGYLKNNNL